VRNFKELEERQHRRQRKRKRLAKDPDAAARKLIAQFERGKYSERRHRAMADHG
jgi:hypothetical protein